MPTINYVEIVTNAKRAARDYLRSEKVQALLGYIAGVEREISDSNRRVENAKHALAVQEYNFRIAEQFQNPDIEEIRSNLEKSREDLAKYVARESEFVAVREAKIAEYNTKIENWKNGTSKVDLERMNTMALAMVREKIGKDFNMGLYEAANNN